MANIKQIAEALVLLSFGDMADVTKVLKEEYDIEVAEEKEKKFVLRTDDLESIKQQAAIVQARLKEEQKRKQKPYAPRKIGKPRGFPENMRRK
jgi:hypothetical protein